MAKLSKRQRAINEKVEPGKLYPFNDALALLKELSSVKFTETIDVAVNLGVDAKKSDQQVRGATTLPNGTGKEVRVAVFTQGANADAAFAMIASGDVVWATKMARDWTPMMGNSEASVTIPKPESEESPFPAAAAMPTPSDRTRGTVTGPVVTAPESHARPSVLLNSGSNMM